MVFRISRGLALAAFALFLFAGVNSLAGELSPVINFETIPDLVFSDQVVQVRFSTGFDREPPKLQIHRLHTRVPAGVEAILTAPGKKGIPLKVTPAKIEIPPYNDTSVPLRLAIPPEFLQTQSQLRVKLKTAYCEVNSTLALRLSREPGEDLSARGAHLYTATGAGVILIVDRYNEAAYRRWAVPKAIRRWLTLPATGGAVYFTTCPHNGKGVIPCMEHDKGLHAAAKPEILRERFSQSGRKLRVVSPGFDNNTPLLGLLAEAGRFHPEGEVTLVIDPGIEDILFGTPVPLYRNALHALVSRLEWLYPAGAREIYFIMPSLPAGLRERGRPYLKAAARVAEERHLAVLPGPCNSRRNSLYLYPTKAAMSEFADYLVKHTDISHRRRILYAAGAIFSAAAAGFVFLQLWNRRRLRKLVAFTCGEE